MVKNKDCLRNWRSTQCCHPWITSCWAAFSTLSHYLMWREEAGARSKDAQVQALFCHLAAAFTSVRLPPWFSVSPCVHSFLYSKTVVFLSIVSSTVLGAGGEKRIKKRRISATTIHWGPCKGQTMCSSPDKTEVQLHLNLR